MLSLSLPLCPARLHHSLHSPSPQCVSGISLLSASVSTMASEPQSKKARLHDGSSSSASTSTTVRSSLLQAAHAPSVKTIVSDRLTALALATWASNPATGASFDAALVDKLYQEELTSPESASTQRVMLLELSKYFEKYFFFFYFVISGFIG